MSELAGLRHQLAACSGELVDLQRALETCNTTTITMVITEVRLPYEVATGLLVVWVLLSALWGYCHSHNPPFPGDW